MLKLTGLETIISDLQDVHAIACKVGEIMEAEMIAAVDNRNYERIEEIVVSKHKIAKEISVHMNIRLSGSATFDKRAYKLSLNRILHDANFKEGLIVEDADGSSY